MEHYLFKREDCSDEYYVVIAKSLTEAKQKLAIYCQLDELDTTVDENFVLEDCYVIQ